MKRFLMAALIVFAFSGVALAGEIQFNKSGKMTTVSDSNPLPVDAEVSVGSLSVSVDPAFKNGAGVATSAILTPEGRVPVDAGTISTTPSFVDDAGAASSSPLLYGKVQTVSSPLKISGIIASAKTIATDSVTTLYSICAPDAGKLVLLQCRTGTIYVGDPTDTAADIKLHVS